MITEFRPIVRKAVPVSDLYHDITRQATNLGYQIGIFKYGPERWGKIMDEASEEKLRLTQPPIYSRGDVILHATPYQWQELQKHRQVQNIQPISVRGPLEYYFNAVALTANALIETDDGKLVFHKKRGGAQEGSVHTFGGYVLPDDVAEYDGNISAAVNRELGEKSEISLKPDEYVIEGYFGTPEGMPSILWGHGTCAVYARVKTGLNSSDLQRRFENEERAESLTRYLFLVPVGDVRMLETMENIHQQTKQVVPTILAIYEQ